jgi:hypothetical protein
VGDAVWTGDALFDGAIPGGPSLDRELVEEALSDAEAEEAAGVGELRRWKCAFMRQRRDVLGMAQELVLGRAREELMGRIVAKRTAELFDVKLVLRETDAWLHGSDFPWQVWLCDRRIRKTPSELT